MKKNFLILIALFALSNMAKAQDAETANRMFRRGYRADIQLEANTYQQSFISTSHGYSFGNGLFIGAGAGFGVEFVPDFNADAAYLSKVFADVRYCPWDFKAAPFVGLRVGTIIGVHETPHAGFMLNPAIGLDWGRVTLKVGYMFQTREDSRKVNCVDFGVAFNF